MSEPQRTTEVAIGERSPRPSWAEAMACLYVLLPVLLFFAMYMAWWIAVPACAAIAWTMVSIVRRAERLPRDGLNVPILFIATLWCVVCAALGGLGQPSDWLKHYAVFHQLVDYGLQADNGEVLRYGVAWYLVPALVAKATGLPYAMGWWTLLGIVIVFRLLVDMTGHGPRTLLVPAVFALFSGADVVGTAWTGYQAGAPMHIEWWAGFLEYGSHMTSLSWVPQHALPAWLVVLVLLRQAEKLSLRGELGVLLAGALLWSPFAAIGLLPFALLLVRRETALDWRNALGVVVALPLLAYLTAGTTRIPAHWVWNGAPCPAPVGLCFGAATYARFAFVEFLVIASIVLAWRRDRAVLVAVATLLVLPLYHFGGSGNDLAMRGSVPALAVLALGVGRMLHAAPGPIYTVPMAALLFLGSVTASLEVAQRVLLARDPQPTAFTFRQFFHGLTPEHIAKLRAQYFGKPPPWLLR